MVDIGELLLHHIKSLFLGLILIVVGIYLIPHEWTIKIIRFIKPSLLKDFFKRNDKYFNSILSIMLDGTYTDNFKDEVTAKEKITKIKNLKIELDTIEKNMFTIDLLTDLFGTLNFAAVNYSMSDSAEVIDNISNYFSHYSNRLEETAYRKNFATDVIREFNELTAYLEESKKYEDKLGDKMSKGSRQMATLDFDRFLKNEKEQLGKTRELLIDSIKQNAIELMDQAK